MSLSRLSRRWQGKSRPSQERSDTASGDLNSAAGKPLVGAGIRASHSHESLFNQPPNTKSLDLREANIQIKPLHSSLIGQEHCFQVSTTNSTKFFSCRTAVERQKWMQHLQRVVQPFQDANFRTDLSLELGVMEAKNLPPKHKYYCEIYLDNAICARTSSKVNGSSLFWGEQFDMGNLPPFSALVVKIFKEGNRNKRKEVNIFIGQVEVPVEKISTRQVTDMKYPIVSPNVSRIAKDATLRLKARYQCIEILPLRAYEPLTEYLLKEYRLLVTVLEATLVNVRDKDEMARTLVYVTHKLRCAKEFLVNILIDEINRQDNQEIFLRGNSIASKAIDAYMKLVGEKYLHDTLGDFIRMVLESPHSFEVNPDQLTNGSDLNAQREHLLSFCRQAWYKIFNSHSSVPVELKLVFSELKSCLLRKTNGNEDVAHQLISACLFLRFLCPAILNPSMFGLSRVLPMDKDARNLTLIAKTIQGLANGTRFGRGKEGFMVCMNDFVEMEATNFKTFLDQISMVDRCVTKETEDGSCYVDLGRELSVLHSLLEESFKSLMMKATEEQRGRLKGLAKILADITEMKNNSMHPRVQRTSVVDIQQNGCDSVCATPRTLHLPPLDRKTNSYDSVDGDTSSQSRTPRYVSNTSFTLTTGSASTPTATPDSCLSFVDVPRTRNTMREMQDSDQYVLLTSEKALPVHPPVTSASVLFRSWTQDRTPSASSPSTSSQLMFAAETSSDDFSAGIFSELEHVINNIAESRDTTSSGHQFWKQKGSSSSLSQPTSASSNGTIGRQQPLSFSNPLYPYTCTKQSSTSSNQTLTSQTSTPPVMTSECCPLNENERRNFATGSMNGSAEPIPHGVPPACARNMSPSPSLGHPAQQRAGILYGCHSHENLPHQRSVPVRPTTRNSVTPATSEVESYFDMAAGGVLSRSMEFPLRPAQSPGLDSHLKRNKTDSLISVPRGTGIVGHDTPPESPTCCMAGHPMARRNGQSQGTVRMGVRSVQRKLQENEKGKLEYEMELRHLRQLMAEMKRKLEQEKAAAINQVEAEWHQKLRLKEEEHVHGLAEKDKEVFNLKEHLRLSEQQNQRQDAIIRDLQLQVKELTTSPGGPRHRILQPQSQALDGRQCSTH